MRGLSAAPRVVRHVMRACVRACTAARPSQKESQPPQSACDAAPRAPSATPPPGSIAASDDRHAPRTAAPPCWLSRPRAPPAPPDAWARWTGQPHGGRSRRSGLAAGAARSTHARTHACTAPCRTLRGLCPRPSDPRAPCVHTRPADRSQITHRSKRQGFLSAQRHRVAAAAPLPMYLLTCLQGEAYYFLRAASQQRPIDTAARNRMNRVNRMPF